MLLANPTEQQQPVRHLPTTKGKTMTAKDPVCGMEVEDQKAAASMTYHGQTYYFCCQGCQDKFQRDPEACLKDNAAEGHHAHHH